jgi:hypothetical protein
MTHHAVDILQRWIAETVHAVAPEEAAKEAARLVTEFRAYAEDAGLNLEELEVDLGQDLLATMQEALIAAAEAEVDVLAPDEE